MGLSLTFLLTFEQQFGYWNPYRRIMQLKEIKKITLSDKFFIEEKYRHVLKISVIPIYNLFQHKTHFEYEGNYLNFDFLLTKFHLEIPGIEPGAFHMQSERATTALYPLHDK